MAFTEDMPDPDLRLQGMAYAPGIARGVLRRGVGQPGAVAVVGEAEAEKVPISDRPAAFIVVDGVPLSHGMIGLVAHNIPVVLVSARQAAQLQPGTEVRVDGASGLVTGDPGDAASSTLPPSNPESGKPVHLADGAAVWLLASVRSARGAAEAVSRGAGGIGLVRSEFLGGDEPRPPDTTYFTAAFEALCEAAAPLRVTVRLLDLAGDKPPRWLPEARELLRPLGRQGAHLFHREPIRTVIDAQLRSLGGLCGRYDLEVLIPYLGRREELTYWTRFVRRELPPGVAVGAMLETPAALLDLANWIDTADFLEIGCNDLMQCLFGADRDEYDLRECLDPYAPVLYRLLRQAAEAAGESLDRVRLCGVLPRLAGTLPVLVGLGFQRFSIEPAWIPYLARNLRTLALHDARELADRVTGCRESAEVRALLGVPADIP